MGEQTKKLPSEKFAWEKEKTQPETGLEPATRCLQNTLSQPSSCLLCYTRLLSLFFVLWPAV